MFCTAGILFLLWGGTVGVLAMPMLLRRVLFIATAETAVGSSIDTHSYTSYDTVLGKFVTRRVYYPIVEFSASNGGKYRFTSASKFYEIPSRVAFPVYYKSGAPEIYLERNFRDTLLFPLSFFMLGAALFFCGLWFLTKALNHSTRLVRMPAKSDFFNAPGNMFMVTRSTGKDK